MTENTFETAVARVLRRHGAAVMDDPIRFRNLLRDYCTSEQCRREINVTILCARSGLLSQICATDTSSPPDVQIGRYAVILHEEYGIDESFGNIFVSTWIKAFDNYRRYIKELSERGILLDNNITSSMINKMGVLYYVGEIVDQDFVEAVTFFEKAAEQSNAEAQFNLGFCYAKGTGCDKDDAVAVKWYRKSAEQGCAVAQCALGLCLLLENGQEIDAEQAVKWFHSAAQQGEPAAQDRLGVCYQNGVGVSQDFAAAAGWFCAAANSGFAEAQFHLGVCYADGVGVLQNDMEAEKWFEKAAMQGVPAAQRLLGLCFLDGRGVSQDFTKALKWFRKAAQQDDAVAQINLASFYEHGYGIVQNSAEALMWYRRAAEQGNQKSKEHLSRFDQIKGTFIQPISGFPEPLSKVVIAPTPMRTWTIPDLGMELIPVAAGSFTMGSHTGSTDETPVRNVHITWDFWMGKTEVTQAQYRKFRGCNPSFFKGDELPVEQVSWEDARTFCEELTQHEQKAGRLPQGYVYRLPTEAEWEYAARGGNKSRGYSYSGGNVLDSVGWAFGNSDEKTHPVGHKAPNELGIYDMSGNVAEWCYGCWDNQFSQLDEIDPIALQGNDEKRLLCGGSWNCGATSCMSNCSGGEDWEKNAVGFRVVLGPSLHVDANWPGRIAPTIPNGLPDNEQCECSRRVKNEEMSNEIIYSAVKNPLDSPENAKQRLTLNRFNWPTPDRPWTIPDIGLLLMPVSPGQFQMGSNDGSENEKPMRTVRISRHYWIGETVVTEAEFKIVCELPSLLECRGGEWAMGVIRTHFIDDFLDTLTWREREAGRLPSGYVYRLPTEAEWEYAARGGSKSKGYLYT